SRHPALPCAPPRRDYWPSSGRAWPLPNPRRLAIAIAPTRLLPGYIGSGRLVLFTFRSEMKRQHIPRSTRRSAANVTELRPARPLQHRDRISWRTGRADDRQRHEYIDEHEGFPLDQPLERHAFVQVDAVLHDEVLMAWVEDVGIDRRYHLDGEIVGAD